MPETNLMKAIYRLRVRSSLFVLIAIIILARPTWTSIFTGIAVCIIGLFIRTWASGYIKKEKELAVSGPYQYTRNPLYLGNFILGLSVAVGTYSWPCVILFAVYFLIFYPPAIREERERMKRLFPEQYEEYKRKVPLFFPTRRRFVSSNGIKFSWALNRKNKEYRALVGSAVVWALLIAKMLIF